MPPAKKPQSARPSSAPAVTSPPPSARTEEKVELSPPQAVAEVAAGCLTCRHYLARTAEYGHCRRYPPVTVLHNAVKSDKDLTCDGPLAIFPITLAASLCGEHAPSLR